MGQKLDLSVLVIHPDPNNLRVLENILFSLGLKQSEIKLKDNQYDGFNVIQNEPQLNWGIIMDMKLDGNYLYQGLEFMKKLRENGHRTPVIAYTGIPLDKDKTQEFYLNGGLRYLLIPFENQQQEIKNALHSFQLYHQFSKMMKPDNLEKVA